MSRARVFVAKLRALFARKRLDSELDDEIRFHLDMLAEDNIKTGMDPVQARQRAMGKFGSVDSTKEHYRNKRTLPRMEDLVQDVRHALRAMIGRPGFAAAVILPLALGIGADTAIFSLWNSVLHAPLPGVNRPEELAVLTNPDIEGSWTGRWNGRTDGPRFWLSYGEFEQLRDHARSFSGLMASQSGFNTWPIRFDGGSWEGASGRMVSGGFFDVLGVRPALGTLFTPVDDNRAEPYAVISFNYWQKRFGGRPDVLGRSFALRKSVFTILGVAPRGFVGETNGQQPDLWLPLRMQAAVLPGFDGLHDTPPVKVMWLQVFGRLRPGVTLAQAEAETNVIFHSGLASFYGPAASGESARDYLDQHIRIQPGGRGASEMRQEFSTSLTALLVAVSALLLIACANLANLLLARGAARREEIALRFSLGATRGRLIRQLVTESLTLAAIGGAASVPVVYGLHRALVRMVTETNADFHAGFSLNPAVLAFLFGATLAVALLFGVLPAWRLTRADAGDSLKARSRGALGSFGQVRSAQFLVSLQLALSLPLLVSAGLLARTAYNLQHADLGYREEHLLLVRPDLRGAIADTARRARLLSDLLGEVRRIPGVRGVSFSVLGLFSGGESTDTVKVEGSTTMEHAVATDAVGPGYFSALGIPILPGRDILESDNIGAPKVCVINEAFAQRFFGRRNPVGVHVIAVDDGKPTSFQVVGVVRNARTTKLRGAIDPRYFVAAMQSPPVLNEPFLLIRTATETVPVLGAVRETIRRADPELAILSALSLEKQLSPLTAQDRITAQIVMVLGGVALALAAIGLYGVLSYAVAQRAGEIAVRIALGAQPSRVVAMILQETAGLVFAGLAAGGGMALGASRLIHSRLYGVAPQDPLILALAASLLTAVALVASYVPAHRASRLDPMAALRQE